MVLRKIHLERSGNPSFFKGRNFVIREKREILHFVNINFFEWQVYEKILHIENFCRWSVLKTLKLKWGKEIVMCPHDPIYFIFCLYYSFSNTKNNIHLTTITYMTLSLMSMMSKTEMYLIFLTSSMMTNHFCTQSNIIHIYIYIIYINIYIYISDTCIYIYQLYLFLSYIWIYTSR